MKVASTLVLLGLVFTATSALTTKDIGNQIANFNTGACKAFMDDPSNTDSDCYKACLNTGTEIVNSFDTSTYTDGSFTTSEFTSKGAVAMIKFMTQMSKCRQVEFVQALDNRASSLSFAAGLGVNTITQIVMVDNS